MAGRAFPEKDRNLLVVRDRPPTERYGDSWEPCCCGLNVPLKFMSWEINPSATVWRWGTHKRCLGHEDPASMNAVMLLSGSGVG